MKVAAVVLAAGLSRRMGTPKMLLRWGATTILGHVLHTLQIAGIKERLVVIGCERESVAQICREEGAEAVFNPDFDSAEMLSSLQVGIRSVPPECGATLIVLGDQPFLEAAVVQALFQSAELSPGSIVVPSFKNQRGHPWLVGSDWWPEILGMGAPETPRDFLRRRAKAIQYVAVETDSILRDIDTMEEYLHSAP